MMFPYAHEEGMPRRIIVSAFMPNWLVSLLHFHKVHAHCKLPSPIGYYGIV
jgi:hypothetical protein